ncbi:ABC transporter substrate-binding protein [Paraburkholderia sediminicola]|uniref:ABC transporter substrate-binding protein n=1 Tax=Paraburkholderia sediminicola TaxID=458836 RepID=UPI0038B8F2F0
MIADKAGYYANEGLKIHWIPVMGGAEVGKQLAAGNGDIGSALGDTPIILRANGVPVKGIALLGGHPLLQLITRSDRKIDAIGDLRGKIFSVMSYQDTSFFVLQNMLATAGMTRNDLVIHAAGPTATWQEVAAGKSVGMIAPPDWGANVESNGVSVVYRPTDEFVPGMGSAIIAADNRIAKDPLTLSKFIAATLHGMKDIVDNPTAASQTYLSAMPSHAAQGAYVRKVMANYAENVYPGQRKPGAFDPAIVEKVQAAYVSQKIVRRPSPVDSLYTNALLK